MEGNNEIYPTLEKFKSDRKMLFDLEIERHVNIVNGEDLRDTGWFESWWDIIFVILKEPPKFKKEPVIVSYDTKTRAPYLNFSKEQSGNHVIRKFGEVPHKDAPDEPGIVFIFSHKVSDEKMMCYSYDSEKDIYYMFEMDKP